MAARPSTPVGQLEIVRGCFSSFTRAARGSVRPCLRRDGRSASPGRSYSAYGSIPSAVKIVAKRFCSLNERPSGSTPSASVRADDDAAFQAAAGHHQAPGVRIMIAPARGIQPRRAAEFAHRDDQRVIEQAALLEIGDEAMQDAVEFRHEHLVDLVLEDVVVPGHAVGDHDERRAVLDEMPRHERVLAEGAGAVARAVFRGQFRDVEQGPRSPSCLSSARRRRSALRRCGSGGRARISSAKKRRSASRASRSSASASAARPSCV